MKHKIRLTESDLRNIINEAVRNIIKESSDTDLNQYVPKKAFKAVDKVNIELRQLSDLTGENPPQLLDMSTGSECFFNVIGDVVIDNGHLVWEEQDTYDDHPHEESWNLIRYDEEEGYWFDEYDFKDQISYLRSCIRKATKYFKEYDSDWDDNERKRNKFFNEM